MSHKNTHLQLHTHTHAYTHTHSHGVCVIVGSSMCSVLLFSVFSCLSGFVFESLFLKLLLYCNSLWVCVCVYALVCMWVGDWVRLRACGQLATLVCRYVCVVVDACINSNPLFVTKSDCNLIVHFFCVFALDVCVWCVCVCMHVSVCIHGFAHCTFV